MPRGVAESALVLLLRGLVAATAIAKETGHWGVEPDILVIEAELKFRSASSMKTFPRALLTWSTVTN